MPSALASRTRPGATNPSSAHQRRLDIEGLRAVAVVAVVLDHLFHWPRGGFVGVDIFFVISGYLISGILLREATATGRVSFRQFYIRRIKRILPAAVVVLSVTVTMAYVFFYSGRASSIALDGLWALLFSANWRFAILGTDYMNSGSSVSPIQHYWSLGVEEQFYIFWPWIILGSLFLARRIRASARGTIMILVCTIVAFTICSFVFALWETQTHHTVAYFSTFSRGWELSAGAILAVLMARFDGLPGAQRVASLCLGLSLLVVSVLLISPETPFPGPNALYPVLGSCLIILAGTGKQSVAYDRAAWVLTNSASRFIGKISYSLYLWHFPVIVFVGAVLPHDSKRFYALAIGLMALLSVASFKLVEDPIRRSSLNFQMFAVQGGWRSLPFKSLALAVSAVVLVAAPLTSSATLGNERSAQTGSPGPVVESSGSITATTAEGRQEQLRSAISFPEWPSLLPDPAGMGPDGALAKPVEWIKDGCLGGELSPLAHHKDVTVNAQRCIYGPDSAAKSVVVFGDSTTMSYVPGIRKALADQDVKIFIYTVAACSPTQVPNGLDASAEECIRFKRWVEERIQSERPALVVSSMLRNDGHLASRATGLEADEEWQRNISAMGDFVIKNGARYVLLEAPAPAKADPSICITRFSKPVDCVTQRAPKFDNNSEVERRAVAALGDAAVYVPTENWFCVDDRCPAFIGNTALYADMNHISARASEELAPLMKSALLP
jgi:peptidoglycan/LPS O-acetylase OafA/YrhL